MKTIEQIIEEQQSLAKERDLNNDGKIDQQEERAYIIKVASQLLAFLRNETLKTELTNQKDYAVALKRVEDAVRAIPKVDKVSVRDTEKVISGLTQLEKVVKGIKFPAIPETIIPDYKRELLAIEKAVKAIKIPETKIPAFPKIPEVDLSALVKGLKALEKAVNDSKTEFDTSEMIATLSEVKTGLADLGEILQRIETKEVPLPEDRTDELVEAMRAVTAAVNAIKLPIPNFQSSWQHSLSMQAEDLQETITYTTAGGKKVVHTRQFKAKDGTDYINTYSYDGAGDCIGWTGWTKV